MSELRENARREHGCVNNLKLQMQLAEWMKIDEPSKKFI